MNYERTKDCPFCGGNGKLSVRQDKFFGFNGIGDKKMKMRLQVICNRCHSRGKPIITDYLVNPSSSNYETIPEEYFDKAWSAWTRRV